MNVDFQEDQKLRELVFERMVVGEEAASVRTQLTQRMSDSEADEIIAEAWRRIEQGRSTQSFNRDVKRICKKRLIRGRYIVWKVTSWIFIASGIMSAALIIILQGQAIGSFGGLIIGAIILAIVEWLEERIIHARLDSLESRIAP